MYPLGLGSAALHFDWSVREVSLMISEDNMRLCYTQTFWYRTVTCLSPTSNGEPMTTFQEGLKPKTSHIFHGGSLKESSLFAFTFLHHTSQAWRNSAEDKATGEPRSCE